MSKPNTQVVREVGAMDCLDFSGSTTYGDWRDDLVKDGSVLFGLMREAQIEQRAHIGKGGLYQ